MSRPSNGSVIVITGAGRGIGAATARLAGAAGYSVCVNYRQNRRAAEGVVGELEAQGVRALAVQADVSVESEVVRLFETSDRELGALSALVNNAGILETQARVESMDADRLHRVLATNVVGAFICAREAVKRLSTKHGGGGGAIVNVSSGAARYGSPNEYVDYAASKGAVDTFTIGLAREVAEEGHSRQRRTRRLHLFRHPRQRRRAESCGSRQGIRADEARGHTGGSRARDSLAALRRCIVCDGIVYRRHRRQITPYT